MISATWAEANKHTNGKHTMKSTGLCCALTLLVGIAALQGRAQEESAPEMDVKPAPKAGSKAESALAGGSWKTTLGGSVSSTSYADSDTTSDMVTLSGSIGYFFVEGLETGLSLQMTGTTQDETDVSTTQFDTYMKLYILNESDVVPYLGANLGVMAISVPDGQGENETTGSMSLGVNVGCEFMMTDASSVFVDLGLRADSEETSMTTVSYGLSFYF